VRIIGWSLGLISIFVAGACSSGASGSGFSMNDDGGTSGGSSGGSSGTSSGTSSGSGSGSGTLVGDAAVGSFGGDASGGGGGTCHVTDPNADMDKDGWTPMQGDCDDCDPNINPGAIDTLHTPADGGAPFWGDEDCSGMPGDNAMACDTGLALTDLTPGDGAKAIELCATASMTDRKYGVISASYVRADGTAFPTVAAQVGIQPSWGTNVKVQAGANMLVLSSGYARTPSQAGACGSLSCTINATGTVPTGFPMDDKDCPPTPTTADDVALQLQVRVPSNATGYAFNFKFYSFEFPQYVCDPSGYNDQFVALVDPPPAGAYTPTGSQFGNISFDSNMHPVSVNLGFFDVCDGVTARFAKYCKNSATVTCPTLPSPYCPLGTGDLAGTGFDVWESSGPAGATRWLQTQAPATPGSIITLRFAIWDAGNSQYDSTVLIDNFHWIATGGTISVGTTPIQAQ
jgi:hypothetical protein